MKDRVDQNKGSADNVKMRLSFGEIEKTSAVAITDSLRLRLIIHPDLRMSLTDARQASLRELVMLHGALDLIDHKKQAAQDEMSNKINSIRKR